MTVPLDFAARRVGSVLTVAHRAQCCTVQACRFVDTSGTGLRLDLTCLDNRVIDNEADMTAVIGRNIVGYHGGATLTGLQERYIPPLSFYLAAMPVGLSGGATPHQAGVSHLLLAKTQSHIRTAAAGVLGKSDAAVGQELCGLDSLDCVLYQATEFLKNVGCQGLGNVVHSRDFPRQIFHLLLRQMPVYAAGRLIPQQNHKDCCLL